MLIERLQSRVSADLSEYCDSRSRVHGERERERKKQRVGDVVATQRGVYSHERTRALQDASHTTPTTHSPSLEHVPAPVPPQLFILYDVDVLLGLFQSSCLDSSS